MINFIKKIINKVLELIKKIVWVLTVLRYIKYKSWLCMTEMTFQTLIKEGMIKNQNTQTMIQIQIKKKIYQRELKKTRAGIQENKTIQRLLTLEKFRNIHRENYQNVLKEIKGIKVTTEDKNDQKTIFQEKKGEQWTANNKKKNNS